MLPKALIVHHTRDRARLRIKEKRDAPEFFGKIRDQLALIPAITDVEINSTTGSVLLLHPNKPWSEVGAQLRALELFEIVDHIEQEPALTYLMTGITQFEKRITETSFGSVDLRTLAFIILCGFALRQIMRGEILGPGLPLLWTALDLARHVNK